MTTELPDRLGATLAATSCGNRSFAGQWLDGRFHFGETAVITKEGKPVRGIEVWLEFDDPATLDGASLRVKAPKEWYRQVLAKLHAPAFAIAVEMVDPEGAAKLRAEMAAHPRQVGDLVGGEDE